MTEVNMDSLKTFYNAVHIISKKHKEVAKITGENFNIFNVLQLHASEVKTHSALLADLLSAKGSHGQGDLFLRLFIEEMDKENIANFAMEKSEAFLEKHIGPLNEERTEGGRIDILIEDVNKKRIIIENKIYAGDQKNQLLRYYNFDKTASLFYLTLSGNPPSDASTGKGSIRAEDFKCISYEFDILRWLRKCKKETVSLPVIRETLTQYINLIEQLTNQATGEKMHKEIRDLIRSSTLNILDAIILCAGELQSIIDETRKDFFRIGAEKLKKYKDKPLIESDKFQVVFDEDGDGIYIGFRAVDKDGKQLPKGDALDNYYEQLRDCSSAKIVKSSNWIGWWNPTPVQRREKFDGYFNKKQIVEFSKDETKMQKEIDELIIQPVEEIAEKFLCKFTR